MKELAVVILAAGKGKRMGGEYPKVLFQIKGKPIIYYLLETVYALAPERVIVVVGFMHNKVEQFLSSFPDIEFVYQSRLLGTADAVSRTKEILSDFDGDILVLCGDVPFIEETTIRELVRLHRENRAAATVLSAVLPDAKEYGRIIRTPSGELERIVEFKDATENEQAVREINSGIMIFRKGDLFDNIDNININNAQGERYLTDMIGLLKAAGKRTLAYPASDPMEVLGINSPDELFLAESYLSERSCKK